MNLAIRKLALLEKDLIQKEEEAKVFGMTSPMEPAFPKIVVRREDEEKALSLVANNSELGLFEVPEELIDDDEEDEDEE